MREYKCPFCGHVYVNNTDLTMHNSRGAVASLDVRVIECPCGATYAPPRGRRLNARSD